MKRVHYYEVVEYTYNSREERDQHVIEMEKDNWEDSGKVRRLKDNVSLMTAGKEDYEYFAHYVRGASKINL